VQDKTPVNIAQMPAFYLAGISVLTSNLNGQSAQDIGNLWATFFTQHLAAQIRGKLTDELICAYTDYASDMNGPYTAVLGYQVDPGEEQAADIIVVQVKACTAVMFESANTEPATVLETWNKIWTSGLHRAYHTDCDLYTADGRVKTFVSINP
jgi:predicted transcriptional regulator YdeE